MFHGTRRILFQISFQLQLLQTIPFKPRELSKTESASTQECLKKVLNKKSTMTKIGDHSYAIGKISLCVLTPDQASVLNSMLGYTLSSSPVQSFERLMLNRVVYHSSAYTRTTIRNNRMCAYVTSDSSTGYGCIQSFYISPHCNPFCFIRKYNSTHSSPITKLRPSRNPSIRHLNFNSYLSQQIIEVELNSNEIDAVPLDRILKSVFM